MFRGKFSEKFQIGFKSFRWHCHINHVKGYLVLYLQAAIASSFPFIEYFQNFSPDLSTKLAKFVWEVPYSVCVATIGIIMGENYVFKYSMYSWFYFDTRTE